MYENISSANRWYFNITELMFLVRLEGFEPPVFKFVAWYSIQLNYRRIFCEFYCFFIFAFFFLLLSLVLLYFDFSFYSSLFWNFLNFFSKSLVKSFFLWYIILAFRLFRGVAQLVARVVWDHEVAGSIPVTSTIFP